MQRDANLLPRDGAAWLRRDVLDRARADAAFRRLIDELPWTEHELEMFGRTVLEPRLSAWIGDEGTAYRYSGRLREPRPWTPALIELRALCESLADARFNSVLANLYRTGSDSMGWHADDEPELGPHPVIASLSLGATRRFRLRHRLTRETVSIDLPAGSLLVMRGPCQEHWQHSLPKTAREVGPRINLTFRRTGSER